MVETSLNMFDLVVLVVVGLSALLSFFRGFIREVLSLGAWVGAALITLYAFPQVTEYIRPKVNSDLVASGLASMGTFIVAPLTSGGHPYPFRIACRFSGKDGHVVLDQIRTVDQERLGKRLGALTAATMTKVLGILQAMFAA